MTLQNTGSPKIQTSPQYKELADIIKSVVLESSDPGAESPLKWLQITKPTIVHPVDGVIPFVPRQYQVDVLEDWKEHSRLILKSRQLGFSQVFAAECYWKAKFRAPRAELIVSRNEDSAWEFMRYVRQFTRQGDLVKDTAGELEFANGSRIKAEAATRSAGRSFAASDIYLDELAHAQWGLEIWQAARPTVATGGSITVFSSPKGRANLFYQLWAGRMGQESWKRYRFPWDVLWDQEWADKEQAQMTREQFATEYGADFADSGGALFTDEDIDACYVPLASRPETHINNEGKLEFILTADVAGGGMDATVIQIWETKNQPYRLIHTERWIEGAFERFYIKATELMKAYKCKRAVVDSTGLGAPMIEEFEARVRGKVEDFVFTRKSKEEALTALQLLVQQHNVRFDNQQLKMELELYQRDDDGLVTDSVMAAAIFAWAMNHKPGRGRLF